MRNYCHFGIASGQFGGQPLTQVFLTPEEAQNVIATWDPGSISLELTEVWMPISKEYFQFWLNGALGSTGYSPGQLAKPFFFLESPRGTGKFEYPGFPRITFGTK